MDRVEVGPSGPGARQDAAGRRRSAAAALFVIGAVCLALAALRYVGASALERAADVRPVAGAAPVEELPDPTGEPVSADGLPVGDELPEGTSADDLREAVRLWAEASSVPAIDPVDGSLVDRPEEGADGLWVWSFSGEASDGSRVSFEVVWEHGAGFSCSVKY